MIVPPLQGSINAYSSIYPGLAPWAMQEYRPVGAHCPTATINPPTIPPNTTNNTITIKQIQKHERTQQAIYTPKHI